MLKEHDRVVLKKDLPADNLRAGDVGVIVHLHREARVFEVEFLALDGNSIAVATVEASQLRAVTAHDVSHARPIQV